ncbi:hypothetical protein CHS0354_020302 [Potamilus streckersoni]|uniref:Cadherin domain-containing protein n=1 Tax=Potamilus streckersoni TaxID=2493646 RepID=A0AAE0VPF7_9BIVA|nr:hypothetical protein CHS0354_020302 [Potamilus streckersoni]
MRRHLSGTRLTLACFCVLAYIFAGQVQANSIPINLTRCNDGIVLFSVSDMTVNGTVLLSYERGIEVSFNPACKSEYFRINSSTSEIVLTSNLTKYCNPTIDCTILCKQDADYRMPLLISITRNAPYTMEFNKTVYIASIRELTPETAILPSFRNQLNIRECNEGSLISSPSFYIIKSTKPDWFTTKQTTTAGIIFSTSLVDYEQLNGTTEVLMTILGEQTLDTSSTTLKAYTNLAVTIIDVDDMNPVFTEDVYHLNITEGNVGLSGNPFKTNPPIHAYDGDRGINDTIIYSIEDYMKSNFSVNNISGEIFVLEELDADEGRDLYVVTIKATQQSNTYRTATSTLSLSVIDIDDNPPIFSPNNYNCNITEHSAVGQLICKVTATDKDKGQYGHFTYELENGNAVDIDPISGYIKVLDSHMLDREKESSMIFKVIAKSFDGSKTDKANVTINLIDINDNSPVFSQSSYNFSVQNINIGDYVGKISAFDLDSGENQKLNYTRGMCLSNIGVCTGESMKCHFPFLIDPESGNITLNGCTAGCIYSTLVSVCDSSHYFSRMCSTTLLVIRVEDSLALPILNR